MRFPAETRGGLAAADGQAIFHFTIGNGLYRGLTRVALACGVSLFGVLLAAFQVLLMRVCGQEDMLIGIPMSGRNEAGREAVVGHFVNLVIVRGDLSGNPSFRELLARSWIELQNASANQELPFAELLRVLRTSSRSRRAPLFRTLLNFLKPDPGDPIGRLLSPMDEPVAWGGLTVAPYPLDWMEEAYDLSCKIIDSDHDLKVKMQYSRCLFTAEQMANLSDCFATLLTCFSDDPDRSIRHPAGLAFGGEHQGLATTAAPRQSA